MYIFAPILILSSTLSLCPDKETNYYSVPSPTLNQPIENLAEKQTKKLLETIFIETVKEELNNKNE